MRNLLYEIGTEELPAGFLNPALKQMQDAFTSKMAELKIDHGPVVVKGTPRRMALIVEDVVEKQDDINEELVGPSVKAGIDADGKFTRAAEGFAKSRGADVNDLKKVDTPKGEYLLLVREVKGKETAELLKGVLHDILLGLSFPKSMRWGANQKAFARPIQWLVALYGDDVISFEHEGIVASNITMGHRFHANHQVEIKRVADYEQILLDNDVIVDNETRRAAVVDEIGSAVNQVEALAGNGRVGVDEPLVDLNTNLVEKPFGVCGSFDEKFLQVPDQVLITSMREHQKYFPVVDENGALLPGFVAVNNTEVKNQDLTRRGHQKVLRARLEDALFFFKSDSATSLESKRDRLDGIVFQAQLGTMIEKSERLIKLSSLICDAIGSDKKEGAARAAYLCKADLISDMVGEFPSLQGVMGEAYALGDGEDKEVAAAIKEHYMPKRAGAELPATDLGTIIGLADRIDTIAGLFGIGQVPSGTADPFGLRRQSLAVLNLISGKKYTISLKEIVHKALALYGDKVDGSSETVDKVIAFIKGRFANDCIAKGIDAGIVEAAISVEFDDVCDALERIDALVSVQKEEAFPLLAAAFKRIRNIIKDNSDTTVNEALLGDAAEKQLYTVFGEVNQEMGELLKSNNYVDALHAMLKLKQPVDTFFDDVMVMAEDMDVRQNRLNLLTTIGELIFKVGDISKIQD